MARFRDGFTSAGASAGLIALMLTLTTGTAVAASRAIDSKDIKNYTVTDVDLKSGAITSRTIRDGSITGRDVRDGTLTAADLAAGSVTGKQIRNRTITGADVNSATLNEVPAARRAKTAGNVNGVDVRITSGKVQYCGGEPNVARVVTGGANWDVFASCVSDDGGYPQLYLRLGRNYQAFVQTTRSGESPNARVEYSERDKADFTVPIGSSTYSNTFTSATVVAPDGHSVFVEATAGSLQTVQEFMFYTVSTRQLS